MPSTENTRGEVAVVFKTSLKVPLLLLAFLAGQHLFHVCVAVAWCRAVHDPDVKDGGGATAPEAVAGDIPMVCQRQVVGSRSWWLGPSRAWTSAALVQVEMEGLEEHVAGARA